jgi:AraC family ethanolamine operon transcriptional activator
MSTIPSRNSLISDFQSTVPASIVHNQTNDVFFQARALPKWNQDYIQISKGKFQGQVIDLNLGPIQLFRETMDKAVDQHGKPWPNSLAIGIPINVQGDGFWCGDKLEHDSIFFLKPNAELKFKTPQSSDIFVAVIDHELINTYADSIEELEIEQICTINGVQPVSQELCDNLRSSFMRVFEGIQSNPQALQDERVIQTLHDDVMHTLFNGLCKLGKIKPHNAGQFVHRHIVEKAKEYILSRQRNPPTVLEICQELRISRRTLHYAFQKVLNINPVTFLRFIRLHGAHHELLTSPPGKFLISEIAAHWGFWHLGMFSSYYKDLFGEPPSNTVRRVTLN